MAVGLGCGVADVPVGLGLGELALGLGDLARCPACPCHCTGTVPAGHAGGVLTRTLARVCPEVRQA